MIISIDIGTSFSSVCILGSGGKTEPVETTTGISIYGSRYSLPSAVFVEEDGSVLVGQAAMNSRKRIPQNFRSEFKRDLGQDAPIVLGQRSFLPEDLYTELFRHMKECAEKGGKGVVEKAYITYPASFGKAKRDKIRQAAKNAGLFDTELVDEPTAAAMCYVAGGYLKEGDVLLVYDFGGGTFDVSLIRYADGAYEALAPAMGIEHCGGIDIDRMIYADILSKVDRETLQQLSANKISKMRFEGQLAELAVKIKHHLSTAEHAKEAVSVGFDIMDYELDREKLDGMIAGLVSQTVECCRGLLDGAGLAVKDLGGILLVGGTSRVPLVQKMVKQFAGDVPVFTDVDPDLAVVMGAMERRGGAGAEERAQEEASEGGGDIDKFCRVGQDYEEKQNYGKAAEWYQKAAQLRFANQDMSLWSIPKDQPAGVERKEIKSRFMNMLGRLAGSAEAAYNSGLLHESEGSYAGAAEDYRTAAGQGYAPAQYRLGLMYADGQGVEQNFAAAAEWYRKAAEQGYAPAQNNLGVLCKTGKGVRQDDTKAAEWYDKAARQCFVLAWYNLGLCLYEGIGVKQDDAAALECLDKAAGQGVVYARYHLGICYYEGRGVEKDYGKAAEWFREAAGQGCAEAQYMYAVLCESGLGMERDDIQAAEYYEKAAIQGLGKAKYKYAVCCHEGRGAARDYIQAVKWYREALEETEGYADEASGAAECSQGRKYEREHKYVEAAVCYRQAAEQGNADAQSALGRLYLSGYGVVRDYDAAASWFARAAEQGHAYAAYQLGVMYQAGQGVELDDARAAELYETAALQGDIDAQYALGLAYLSGRGVQGNELLAEQWLLKADAQGHARASYHLGIFCCEGKGTQTNESMAPGFFERAAELGIADAQNTLGVFYAQGRSVTQDWAKAAEWYEKAAEQDHAEAEYNLALLLYDGRGVGQDYGKALEWFARAARQGIAAARYNLGVMYEVGRGCGKDYAQAAQWYEQAALQGHVMAMKNLASLYAKGNGVKQDDHRAVYWYEQAASSEREIDRQRISRI